MNSSMTSGYRSVRLRVRPAGLRVGQVRSTERRALAWVSPLEWLRASRTMNLPRLIVSLALALFSALALAQEYPTRPVRIVVPFSAGGPNDIIARLVAHKLGEALGHQMVIDNRPGAGGNIGTDSVAKAPADGYTLLSA